MKTPSFVSLLVALVAVPVIHAKAPAGDHLRQLAETAVSPRAAEAEPAMAALRMAGPSGLDALFEVHADELEQWRASKQPPSFEQKALREAIERVAAQRDAHVSGLYWFTDIGEAKAAAAREGKPIVSLRLLGRLDEELSCANSRYFRTTLYANEEISALLRTHFVLHWESVRPAPIVTVDFGDGRTLQNTITGNSMHLLLDADGTLLDALPGLYGGQRFLQTLGGWSGLASNVAQLESGQRAEAVRGFHRAALAELQNRFGAAWQDRDALRPASRSNDGHPTAAEASRLLVSKTFAEAPILREVTRQRSLQPVPNGDTRWQNLALGEMNGARLDERSRAWIAAKRADTEDPSLTPRMIEALERAIAEDTARNELLVRPEIHQWFIEGGIPGSIEDFTGRVYAELFLTPAQDPWLGLAPLEFWPAIEADGLAR